MNSESIKALATVFKDQFTTLDTECTFTDFKKFLDQIFDLNKPAESLVHAMFERFKPFRLEGVKDNIHVAQEKKMRVLDFILAMNLLARIVYDKKLKLLFELCDDDDDGCMTPADILNMLQKVERVFSQECARVQLDSSILNNFVADKKAEQNFHFIMAKHQSMRNALNMMMQEKENAQADDGKHKKG